MPFDVEAVRADFPLLGREIHGRPLVYLDHAATSQKPQVVIDAVRRFYTEHNANIHRGVYALSNNATESYAAARRTVQRFLNAADAREIVFVRSTTEAINLVAATYGRQHVATGDQVVVSELEHHSNIVPWQLLCEATGAHLRVLPMNDEGELPLEGLVELLSPRTKILAISHVSNALGSVNPIREMAALAHEHGAAVVVDGAQAAPHLPVDVRALDCDFYAFSGHKACGPTGIGALYGRAHLLDTMPPYQGGGDMIASVTFERTTYAPVPAKFEAGTPHIAGAIGLDAALDYLSRIGLDAIASYEADLLAHATEALAAVPGVRIIGTAREKAAIVSFVMEGVHPHDIGTILDNEAIAIRTGHHCAQPVMRHYGLPATARASLAFYNTLAEIDALAAALVRVGRVFR
jgi:cysteine desulfurase/selenocysteine lyase